MNIRKHKFPELGLLKLHRQGQKPGAYQVAFWGIIIVFIALGFLLTKTWYRYQINPDAISYIGIAEKYADFNFHDAINGYWSPLFSWLLVPFLWLHRAPLLASKCISLVASVGILWLFHDLLRKESGLNEKASLLVTLGLAATLLVWVLPGPISPDVLFVAVLMAELKVLLLALQRPTWKHIILLGLLGALLYFTKAFGFYVFIAQIIICFGLQAYRQNNIRANLVSAVKVLYTFLLIIAPFVLMISIKYHQPTINTAAVYNHGILAPENKGRILHPYSVVGPFAPPNPSAYSAWEDPTSIPTTQWSIIGSGKNLLYFLSLIYSNLVASRDYVISFGALSAAGFVLLVIYACRYVFRRDSNATMGLFGISSLLVLGGYCLLTVEFRYLWVIVPLSLLALTFYFKRNLQQTGSLLLIAVFVLASIWINISVININKDVSKLTYNSAASLAQYMPPGSKILSSEGFGSLILCFYDDLRCYGTITPTKNEADNTKLYEKIQHLGIEYYVYYGPTPPSKSLSNFLKQYMMPYRSVGDVTIYKIRD